MNQLRVPISEKDHIIGSLEAPIRLVEYGDYQCPFCAQAQPRVKNILEDLGHDLCFVYRHFPLTQLHEYAFPAAIAAESAGLKGKFWEMHELLFVSQDFFGEDDIFLQLAEKLNIKTAEFKKHFNDEDLAAKIQKDFSSGVRSGVSGTPSFFLNGQKLTALPDSDALMHYAHTSIL